MSIQSQIDALLIEADALRPLPEDEPLKAPLAGIIDHINQLRAMQAVPGFVDSDDMPDIEKRKPGRPRKGVEGADA